METKILMAYASKYGSTQEVAEAVAEFSVVRARNASREQNICFGQTEAAKSCRLR